MGAQRIVIVDILKRDVCYFNENGTNTSRGVPVLAAWKQRLFSFFNLFYFESPPTEKTVGGLG